MSRRARSLSIAILLQVMSPQYVLGEGGQSHDTGTSSGPNIVFLLADDLGFSDTQPYGGEISTPTISALAEQGVRFTNYHTAANCAPARAMLLTGVNNHRAGVGNIPETVPLSARSRPEYRGVLGRNVVTIATLLEDAGYHTYLSGKWHLGHQRDQLPSRRGFQRTLALADSGADNWEPKPYLPIYDKANWYADGAEADMPSDFYSSELLVDTMIDFIASNREDGQPFFAYLPFQAVHIPVQAPQEFIDRYMGVYDRGWDSLRQARLQRAVALGVVPEGIGTVTMPTTEDWDALSDEQKRYQAKSMAVYAGMVEAMDFHMGRLLDYLREIDEYDNTLFVFTSDNGSEASGPADATAWWSRWLTSQGGYSIDYERLGLKGTYNAISPSFASASASPLAYYKFYVGEGGMRVPLIISGPLVTGKGRISTAFSFATDIAATILSYAGVEPPQGRYAGRPVEPMTGRDLSPLLSGEAERVYGDGDAVGYELAGNSALFQGDYKLVRNRGPVGDNQWRLYDIVSDPGETADLRETLPERFASMQRRYQAFAEEHGVLPVADGYNYQRQVVLNGLHDRGGPQLLTLLITALVLLPFFLYSRLRR
jgi:arylsulfatase/uncharacterized sulfatase